MRFEDEREKLSANCIDLIKTTQTALSEYADEDAMQELQTILTEFKAIDKEHEIALQALNTVQPENDSESVGDQFRKQFETLINSHQPSEEQPATNSNDSNDDDDAQMDISIVCTQSSIPMDPISKCKIKVPARNKVCNHIYEYDIIVSYLQTQSKKKDINRKKRLVACPYGGCINRDVRIEHIIKDMNLQNIILSKQMDETAGTSFIDV